MKGLILFLTLLINVVYVLAGAVYRVVNVGSNSYLNIRNGPGINYSVIGSLHNKDLIYVISVTNVWAKFYKGYVSMDYLKKATGPVKYITTEDLNFRKGPSTSNARITTLNKGTVINYYGRDPFYKNWAVTNRGYASVTYLKKHNKGKKKGDTNQNNKNKKSKSAKLKKAEAASDIARQRAHPESTGWCAMYVADALEDAGFSFTRQGSACQYYTNGILKGMGFSLLSSKPKKLKKGDVPVHECNDYHIHGHIQIYDGNRWYSDFVQNSENIYASNVPPIHYYRIPN